MEPTSIPLLVPDLRGREAEYLSKCVTDNWISSAGPYVKQLEEEMAALTECAHGVSMCNGTIALQVALTVAGVQPGDHVMVPDWTFAASANAVVHAGGKPHFVDIAAESWCMDPQALAVALAECPGRVGAVVVVHAHGQVADMDAICALGREHGVPVIEDAAGALGARYKGRAAGGIADAAIVSFNGNKSITAGGGGVLLTNNKDWADHARHISTQARIGERYEHDAIGSNYRMTNLNAAVAIAQLERFEEMLATKREIEQRYDAAFTPRNDIQLSPRPDWSEGGRWIYSVICVDNDAAESLVAHLRANRIEARHFWQSLSDQPPYADYPAEACPNSRAMGWRVVSLPCSSSLSEADQQRVIDAVMAWRMD